MLVATAVIDVAQQLDVPIVVEIEDAVVVAAGTTITGVLPVTAFGTREFHDDASFAVIVIGVDARAREIGQPFLAVSASVWN